MNICDTVTSLEGETVTIMKFSHLIVNLEKKLEQRIESVFIPLSVRQQLSVLTENGLINEKLFKAHVQIFFAHCLKYLKSWDNDLKISNHLKWVSLIHILMWKEVSDTYQK